ncbi:MAG: hypothetical protein IPO41_02290 [Acidobacteria bacterium]|nr:hypothetical protein [Acidobacteriota bacterium]
MSSLAWLIVVIMLLTLLGSGTLFVVTVKYYWGVRGAPAFDRRRATPTA